MVEYLPVGGITMEDRYEFVDEFKYKIDKKRRLAIPISYYNQLSDKHLILTRALVHEFPMIAVFPDREILVANFSRFYDGDFNDLDFRRSITRDFSYREIDCAKRINLNKYSDVLVGDEATIVGVFDFFEIWDTPTYERHAEIYGRHI